MKKNLVYLVGLLLTFIFMSGCESKSYFIDRGTKVHPVEQKIEAPSVEREAKVLPVEKEVKVHLVEKEIATPSKVSLSSDAYFALNSSYMKNRDKSALNALANEINRNKSKITKIEIVGHSDSIGGDENYNQWLSKRRANRVATYLQSQGVSCDFDVFGVGSKEPVVHCAKNNRAELVACLSPNRRVEIKFLNKFN